MLITKAVFTIVFACLGLADSKQAPATFNNGQLQLHSTVFSEIKKRHSDFRPLSSLSFTETIRVMTQDKPMAVIGNFNGDEIPDLVLKGYSKKERKFYTYLVVSHQKGNYRLIKIDERSFQRDQATTDFVTFVSKGAEIRREGKTIEVIQLETYDEKRTLSAIQGYYYSSRKQSVVAIK